MSYRNYIRGRLPEIFALALFLLCETAFGFLADIPPFFICTAGLGTCAVWFFCSYVNYAREKEFLKEIEYQSEHLDKAYLLAEILEEPDFFEGKIVYEAMRRMGRSMTEQICEYEKNSREYKEFIELWVHEVKLPIATGKLLVENNRGFYDESMLEELDKIDAYAEQALFYARSNYVEKDYVLNRISLRKTAGEVLKRNRKALLKSHISIEFHDLDEEVYSDGKWLEFILQQILSNSIKYMGEGERKLEWYAVRSKEQVKLYLWDTGIGIPKEDLARVFEKGFTGTNGRIEKKSTGMGLYLCKKLCEKMGHRLEIISAPQKGCLAVISFPVGSMTQILQN